MLENKDIKFRVLYEDNGTTAKFASLDKVIEKTTSTTTKMKSGFSGANNMLMSTSRIVQDMPYGLMGIGNNITFLAEQFAVAKSQGVGFGMAMKEMMASLVGTGGVVFAISLLTSALTYLSMQSTTSKKEMETFAEILERSEKGAKSLAKEISRLKGELTDIAKPSFWQMLLAGLTGDSAGDVVTGNIQSGDYVSKSNQLRELNKEKDRQNKLTQIAISLTNGEAKSIGEVVKQNMLRDKDLRFIQEYLDDELDKIPKISEHYKTYAKALELVNNQLNPKKQSKDKKSDLVYNITDINNALQEMLTTILSVDSAMGQFTRTTHGKGIYQNFKMGTVPEGKSFDSNYFGDKELRQFEKENKFMIDSIKDGISIIKSEWNNMWEDVFGKANSLFEKFMSNMLERLAEQALTNLAGSLLNMILPGAGSAFQALLGAPSYGGGGVIQNNIIIGERQVATIYTSGKQAASRLRM